MWIILAVTLGLVIVILTGHFFLMKRWLKYLKQHRRSDKEVETESKALQSLTQSIATVLLVAGLVFSVFTQQTSEKARDEAERVQDKREQQRDFAERRRSALAAFSSESATVRLGALLEIRELVRNATGPEQQALASVSAALCAAYVRDHATPSRQTQAKQTSQTWPTPDVSAAMALLSEQLKLLQDRSPSNDSTLINIAINLRGVALAGLRGSGLYLVGVDLTGADLGNAQLNGAEASKVNLTGANLQGAILSAAVFRDSTMCHANLTGARTTGALFNGCDVKGAILMADPATFTHGQIEFAIGDESTVLPITLSRPAHWVNSRP